MNELQKLLQRKKELVAEIRAMLDKANSEKRNLTEDEDKIYLQKEEDLRNLNLRIERERKLVEEERDLETVEPPQVGSRGTDNIEVGKDRAEDKPFRSLGHFVETTFNNPHAPNLRNYQSNIGETGGFLIPKEFLSNILQFQPEENIVRSRAQIISADPAHPDAAVEVPVLKQGDEGVYGGVETYWNGEGRPVAKSGAGFEFISLQPNELSGITRVTNKLLRNASSVSGFIENMFRMALNGAEDRAFLSGDGIAKPLGLISPNNKGAILVKRTTSNDIKYEDVVELLSKMIPTSRNSCFFLASQSAFSKLKDLKDSAGNRIFSQILHPSQQGFTGTLDGIPLLLTGKVSTLGNTGDLSLVDAGYYLLKDGISPMIAYSEHVEFEQNRTLIKIVKSVDGQMWNREPLTLEDGSTKVSGVVILKK